jgi:hypothetical protein
MSYGEFGEMAKVSQFFESLLSPVNMTEYDPPNDSLFTSKDNLSHLYAGPTGGVDALPMASKYLPTNLKILGSKLVLNTEEYTTSFIQSYDQE